MNLRKKLKESRGQAIVELAILLPVLLLILLGILEFGRVFSSYMIITHASREGARVGAVGGSDLDVQNTVSNNTATLDSTNMTVTILDGGNRGEPFTVKVGYDIKLVTPLIGVIVGDPLHMEAETSMRIE